MADLAYKVTVDTAQAQKSLDNLDKSIGGLKSALAGLAIGNFIANAFRGAEAIQDLADATGFATQSILGIGRAFQENGSSIQVAQESIARFTKTVGEAADGNGNLQRSFQEVGISLQDLATLSEEQLFLKTIQGLGQITDAATRARLASELLGKSARANFAGIAGSVGGYIAASADAARANEAADKAAANFERAITNLKDQLLIVLTPLSNLASSINVAGERIAKFLEIVKNVAIVAGAFFAVTKAVQILVGAFTLLARAPAMIIAGWKVLTKTFEIIRWQFGKIREAGEITKKTLDGLTKRSEFLKLGLDLLSKGFGVLVAALTAVASFVIPDTVSNAVKKLGEMFGFAESEADKLAEKKKKLDATLADNDALLSELEANRRVIDALNEKIKAIQQVGQAYSIQNAQVIEAINNEAKYLQMSERQAEVQKTIDDLNKRTADTIQGLLDQKAKLTDQQVKEKEAIDQTIASIKTQSIADAKRITDAITNLQKEREAIDARNRAIEFGNQIRQDTAALEQMQSEIDMLYMTADERENYSKLLQAEGRLKERLADIDKEAATAGQNVTDTMIADWNRRREAAIAYYNSEKQLLDDYKAAQDDQTRQINVWSKETQKALEDSISPANQVKNFWDGLSNQIDNFARTGKFKVKEFLAGIIQDFLAAKLKLAALDFLKVLGFGGGGGLFGGAIIPGFLAGGGNAQQDKPYIVGEKGPELFVPPTAGRVVPNHAMTGAPVSAPVTNNYNTYNINAVDAQSVAQLFVSNRKTLLGSLRMAEKEMPYG